MFSPGFLFFYHIGVNLVLCRSWWKQHIWEVTVGVLVTLVFGGLIFVMWLLWTNRRQEVGSYEPVGAAAREQELQPL